MKTLDAFQHGDGAHCGLSDWYEEGEAQLAAVLANHAPFDTGWYSSKKEIASARIWSEDGIKIKVEASVSDDFDTTGWGYISTTDWGLNAIRNAISFAWDKAEKDRNANQEYEGFRIGRDGRWEETYLINIGWGENLAPPGDNYHWWGWQYDGEDEGQGVPHAVRGRRLRGLPRPTRQQRQGAVEGPPGSRLLHLPRRGDVLQRVPWHEDASPR